MNGLSPSLPLFQSSSNYDLGRRNYELSVSNHALQKANEELMRYATRNNCKQGMEFGGVDVGCVNCKDGTFRVEGAPQCAPCAEGMGAKEGSYFCTLRNNDSPTVACPHMHVVKGYNGTAALGTNCEKCDTSQNQYKMGSTVDLLCNTCEPGSTIDHRKLFLDHPQESRYCPENLFLHEVKDMAIKLVNPCAPCEPGTFEVGGKCIHCPPGQFTDASGQTECRTCENPNAYAFSNKGGKTCQDSSWYKQQQATGQNTYLSGLMHALDFSKDEGYESELTPMNQELWAHYMDKNNIKMCAYSRK